MQHMAVVDLLVRAMNPVLIYHFNLDLHNTLHIYLLLIYLIYYINIYFFITLPGLKLILNAACGKCGFIGEGNKSSIDYHFKLGFHNILHLCS